MTFRFIIALVIALGFSGCSVSSIDAKKNNKKTILVATLSQLTEQDVFGNEATLNISEENIQDALNGERLSVPLHSSIILVQSGSQAPEVIMQQEMNKYYAVSTFPGIPDKKKTAICNKENVDVENINYMQALRYIAAKGKQKAILVYWGKLETGKYDPVTKNISWSEYKNEKLTGTGVIFRYLLRFALVDVATGEWATYSPVNYEYSEPVSIIGSNDITEQQLIQLKAKTYERAVTDFVNRYK
ncbi:hypothetical protein FNZ18_20335 [Salmonella enterica subsp. salamae]|nr:hypothetical protein [Salmonella enterica subsp. salamae]